MRRSAFRAMTHDCRGRLLGNSRRRGLCRLLAGSVQTAIRRRTLEVFLKERHNTPVHLVVKQFSVKAIAIAAKNRQTDQAARYEKREVAGVGHGMQFGVGAESLWVRFGVGFAWNDSVSLPTP